MSLHSNASSDLKLLTLHSAVSDAFIEISLKTKGKNKARYVLFSTYGPAEIRSGYEERVNTSIMLDMPSVRTLITGLFEVSRTRE